MSEPTAANSLPQLPPLPPSPPEAIFPAMDNTPTSPPPAGGPKKAFPFIWLAVIISAVTLASTGTYYVLRTRGSTSTSAEPISEVPANPFAATQNPFADTPANPFQAEAFENPFSESTDSAYQNPFEDLQ